MKGMAEVLINLRRDSTGTVKEEGNKDFDKST